MQTLAIASMYMLANGIVCLCNNSTGSCFQYNILALVLQKNVSNEARTPTSKLDNHIHRSQLHESSYQKPVSMAVNCGT